MLQDAGSLASMFRDIGVATGILASIVMADSEEVGENEWLVHYRFKPGFAAYPEYCEFSVGMLTCSAVMFGFPPALVIHESCECRGDDACLFRVRWDAIDDQRREAALAAAAVAPVRSATRKRSRSLPSIRSATTRIA